MAAPVTATISLDAEIAKLDQFLDLFLVRALATVKAKTPVRSGVLRDGWEGERVDDLITMGNAVPYAEHVENGTPFQAPQGMLRTTVEEAQQIADDIINGMEK